MGVEVSLVGMKIIAMEGEAIPVICADTGVEGFSDLLEELEYLVGARPDLLLKVELEEPVACQYLVLKPRELAEFIQEEPQAWDSSALLEAAEELASGMATYWWFRARW